MPIFGRLRRRIILGPLLGRGNIVWHLLVYLTGCRAQYSYASIVSEKTPDFQIVAPWANEFPLGDGAAQMRDTSSLVTLDELLLSQLIEIYKSMANCRHKAGQQINERRHCFQEELRT